MFWLTRNDNVRPGLIRRVHGRASMLGLALTGIGALSTLLRIIVDPIFLSLNILLIAVWYAADRLAVGDDGLGAEGMR